METFLPKHIGYAIFQEAVIEKIHQQIQETIEKKKERKRLRKIQYDENKKKKIREELNMLYQERGRLTGQWIQCMEKIQRLEDQEKEKERLLCERTGLLQEITQLKNKLKEEQTLKNLLGVSLFQQVFCV